MISEHIWEENVGSIFKCFIFPIIKVVCAYFWKMETLWKNKTLKVESLIYLFLCHQVTTSSPCIFENQCGKSRVRLLVQNDTNSTRFTTLETPEEKELPLHCISSKLLCQSLICLTWVNSHSKGNLCGPKWWNCLCGQEGILLPPWSRV